MRKLKAWRNAVYNDLFTYLSKSGHKNAEQLAASEVDTLIALAKATKTEHPE